MRAPHSARRQTLAIAILRRYATRSDADHTHRAPEASMTFVPDPDTSAAQWGVLAGRLRDSATSPRTEPRTHPRIVAALTPLGLDALNPDPEITRSSSAAERAKAVAEGHKGFEEVYVALPNETPGRRLDRCHGGDHRRGRPDGNEIQLHITRPHDLTGPLSCGSTSTVSGWSSSTPSQGASPVVRRPRAHRVGGHRRRFP